MLPEDQLRILLSWFKQDYGLGMIVSKPGERCLNGDQEKDKRLMLVMGSIELRVADAVSYPGIGEEVFIPAGKAYSVINNAETPNIWFYGSEEQSEEKPIVYPLNNGSPFGCSLDFYTEHVIPLTHNLNLLVKHIFSDTPERMPQFFHPSPEETSPEEPTVASASASRCIIS
jgi:hypothetical protein